VTWLFCAGMIRSGSTLQYQLASAIVERAAMGTRIPYAPEADFVHVREQYSLTQGMKVFKVHIYTAAFADECKVGGAKVVYSYRDIRDVAVSAMRKFGMAFDDLVEAKWLDQAIADYWHWTRCPSVCVSRYEDFVDDVAGEAEKINKFLEMPLTLHDVCHLAKEFGIERQRTRISKLNELHSSSIMPKEIVFDPVELIHHNHIYQGEVGGWRKYLLDSEQYLLTERFSVWLEEHGYDTRI